MASHAGAPALDIEAPEGEQHALLWSAPAGLQRRAAWRLAAGSVAALLLLSAVAALAPAVGTGAPKCAEESCRSTSRSLDATLNLKVKGPKPVPAPAVVDEKPSPASAAPTLAANNPAAPGEEVTNPHRNWALHPASAVVDEKPSPAHMAAAVVETIGASTTSPGEETTEMETMEVAETSVMDENPSPAPGDATVVETIGASTTSPGKEVNATTSETFCCKAYGCVLFKPFNECQCNPECVKFGSCCDDYEDVCEEVAKTTVMDENPSQAPMAAIVAETIGASTTSPGEKVTTTEMETMEVAKTTVMDENPSPAPMAAIVAETTGASATSPGEEVNATEMETMEVATATVMDE